MKIKSLKLTNFMLFKNFNESFEDKDVIGIIAQWKSNKSRSNRSGKSSIIEAVRYNLFGSSRASKEIELIHNGEKLMQTEMVLTNGKQDFTISRIRYRNGKGKLSIDWSDKKKEAQVEINKLVGLSEDEFILTNFFQQSDLMGFMELSAAKKKEYFMAWLKNTYWNDLSERVQVDIKEKLTKIQKLEAEENYIDAHMADTKDLKADIQAQQEEIDIMQSKLVPLQESLDEALAKQMSKSERSNIKQEILEIENYLDDYDDNIDGIDEEIGDVDAKIYNLKKKLKEYPKYDADKLVEERVLVKQHTAKVKELKNQLRILQKDMCGICPILNESCDRVEPDTRKIKSIRKKIKSIESGIEKRNDLIDSMGKHSEIKKQLDSLQNRREKLCKDLSDAEVVISTVKAYRSKIKLLRGKLKNKTNDKISELKNEIDTIEEGLALANRKLGALNSDLKRHRSNQKRLKLVTEKIQKLNTQLEHYKYVAFMFSKNGIPSLQVENSLKEVEDDANYILRKLNSVLQIEFNADRELGSFDDKCICGWTFPKGTRTKTCNECGEPRPKKRRDELHVTVDDQGEKRSFNMESGGGKTLIALSVRIALSRLMQRRNDVKFNVLFLDEIDSALDEANRTHIMSLVTNILIKDLGVKQVFWVSHSKNIQESVPYVLQVNRRSTYSKVRWI